MQVWEVLAGPHAYLGDRIVVEGSAHISECSDKKKHVWISNSITNREDMPNSAAGLLIMFPGVELRLVSPRAGGSKFPFIGFKCEGILVKTAVSPFTYALMDLSAAQYKQLDQDEWCGMSRELVPNRTYIQDIISCRASDEKKADAILHWIQDTPR